MPPLPGLTRRHSAGGRGSRSSRSRSNSASATKKVSVAPPARYKMELPPTLYGEDLVNGNTELMTQSMDPSMLTAGLDIWTMVTTRTGRLTLSP